jgi:hypothetical protein
MEQINWGKPVRVATGRGFALAVHGPRDALACLEDWPARKGPFYRHARIACRTALIRPDRADHARQAFVAAFLDAELPFA